MSNLSSFPPLRPDGSSRRQFPTYGLLALLLALPGSLALAQQSPPPVEVTVVQANPHDTPVTFEFPGKTESSREVEIRARVTGYLDKIAYREGAMVKQGELLFEIDPRTFKADLANAMGNLAQEQAKLDNARATLNRIKPLAKENAVSQKDLDDANAAVLTAQAAVQSAKAKVQDAEINLGYTTIRSPLAGLSSRSQKKVGSLISAETGDNLLTTIFQLDPIWVNFSIGENDILKYREARATGHLQAPESGKVQVELVLADNSVYPQKGIIDYVAPTIDPQTSTQALRATVRNPQKTLMPGLFVRVRLEGLSRTNVIMIPQRAVMQGPQGKFVYVVGADNKAEAKPVQVGAFNSDQWIVTSGLTGGEQVIVDGVIKVRPGSPVRIVPAAAAPKPAGQP